MRHLIRYSFIAAAMLVLAVWAILPLDSKLRRGKDLAGGTSLVYQVDIRPGDPADTVPRMIDLLKKRLDPNGVLEIGIVQQGANRIEITMPLPNEQVKRLKSEFNTALQSLGESTLTPEAFARALATPKDARGTELVRLAGGNADRLALLDKAAAEFDRSQEARLAFNRDRPALDQGIADLTAAIADARAKNEPAAKIDELTTQLDAANQAIRDKANAPALAEQAYEEARDAAKATAISAAEVRRAFELPARDRTWTDAVSGKTETIPSPRTRSLARLKERYPNAVQSLDVVLAKYNEYQAKRSTLDDPQDIVRLLRGAGVLTFRITVNPAELSDEPRLRDEIRRLGPRNVRSSEVRWYKINKLESWFETNAQLKDLLANPAEYFLPRGYVVEEFDGQYYMLGWDVQGKRLTQAEGGWKLARSYQSADELGRPAIAFEMDALGGDRMGALTGGNIGSKMAVILDDEVYTAPNIQSRIGNRGQITGSFSGEEIRYITRVLGAGALAAKLSPSPMSENTIAPELGADNLRKGLLAGVVSFILVTIFMLGYYFYCGAIAIFALICNALLILAAMALNRATFTLPGIAGVILTFGMAIDANVLIYERMREELKGGADLRTAIRLGYSKALSAIVDGNITNLIVCVVLAFTGTPEIKGFALTMSIGTITTLICQLFITRIIFTYLTDVFRWKKISMLPLAVPAVQRLFDLKVDWMRYRWAFASVSIFLTIGCLGIIIARGSASLDNEFRGGTKVTLQLRENNGERMKLTRAEVENRIEAIATNAERSTDPLNRVLGDLKPVQVAVINPDSDGITSSTFSIKTTITNGEIVQDAIAAAFNDVVETQPALKFANMAATDALQLPVRPIVTPSLGDSIDRPDLRLDVRAFVGGAAVLVEGLEPPPTLRSLEERIAALRNQPDFASVAARPHRWIVLDGNDQAVKSAVMLALDESSNFLVDEQRWNIEVKQREWKLVVEALGSSSTMASVESFSAEIAGSFAANAVVAVILSSLLIVIYIWVRFQSLRYSAAALATSLHDGLVAVGLIVAADLLYTHLGGIARPLGILPFKIDLNVVAAVLTILGYSLNDTIVVMDRIRENRGKLPTATRKIVNNSINQTLSRTIITGGSTLTGTLVLYLIGGEAIRAFAFCFIIGLIVGTYSSIAVAAPIVWSAKEEDEADAADPARARARTLS